MPQDPAALRPPDPAARRPDPAALRPPDPAPFIALPTAAELRARAPAGPVSPYDFGFIGDMSRLLSAHPRIGPAVQRAFAEIMFAPGALDRAEREMVAAVASAAQDCEY